MRSTFMPIKVIDIDLQDSLIDLEPPTGYETIQVLIRLQGEPLGYVTIPSHRLSCVDAVMSEAVLESYSAVIARRLIGHEFSSLITHPSDVHRQLGSQASVPDKPPIPVTVAVCTRDRTADLAKCLSSIM